MTHPPPLQAFTEPEWERRWEQHPGEDNRAGGECAVGSHDDTMVLGARGARLDRRQRVGDGGVWKMPGFQLGE